MPLRTISSRRASKAVSQSSKLKTQTLALQAIDGGKDELICKMREMDKVLRHIERLVRFYEREMDALVVKILKAGRVRRKP